MLLQGGKLKCGHGQQLLHQFFANLIINRGDVYRHDDLLSMIERLSDYYRDKNPESEGAAVFCSNYPRTLKYCLDSALQDYGIKNFIGNMYGDGYVIPVSDQPKTDMISAMTPQGRIDMFRQNGEDIVTMTTDDGEQHIVTFERSEKGSISRQAYKIMRAMIPNPERRIDENSKIDGKSISGGALKTEVYWIRAGFAGDDIVKNETGKGYYLNSRKCTPV